MGSKVAIIVPSLNRPEFVIRQLQYYAAAGSPHPVYIADSSDEARAGILRSHAELLKSKLDVSYFHLPKADFGQCFLSVLPKVREKYACYIGDDDLQIPSTLSKCAEFLDANADFASARGHAVAFSLAGRGTSGSIAHSELYPQPEILGATAADRVTDFFANYFCSLFSVVRTEELLRNFELSREARNRDIGHEILPSALVVARGKSKRIDALGFLRQSHPDRYFLQPPFDWLINPTWNESYFTLEKCLSERIAEVDSVPREVAVKAIKRAFAGYVYRYLGQEFPAAGAGVQHKLAKIHPWLGKAYGLAKAAWSDGSDNASATLLTRLQSDTEFAKAREHLAREIKL